MRFSASLFPYLQFFPISFHLVRRRLRCLNQNYSVNVGTKIWWANLLFVGW